MEPCHCLWSIWVPVLGLGWIFSKICSSSVWLCQIHPFWPSTDWIVKLQWPNQSCPIRRGRGQSGSLSRHDHRLGVVVAGGCVLSISSCPSCGDYGGLLPVLSLNCARFPVGDIFCVRLKLGLWWVVQRCVSLVITSRLDHGYCGAEGWPGGICQHLSQHRVLYCWWWVPS